jgi:hypothetical protein
MDRAWVRCRSAQQALTARSFQKVILHQRTACSVLKQATHARLCCSSNVRDRAEAARAFSAMDANADGRVTLDEFAAHTAAALAPLTATAVDARVAEVLDGRFGGRHQWDLRDAMCGPPGLLPLLAELRRDAACESVDVSGCKLDGDPVCALADALHGHPVRIPCASSPWMSQAAPRIARSDSKFSCCA